MARTPNSSPSPDRKPLYVRQREANAPRPPQKPSPVKRIVHGTEAYPNPEPPKPNFHAGKNPGPTGHPAAGPTPSRGPVSSYLKEHSDRRSPRKNRALGWTIKAPLYGVAGILGLGALAYAIGVDKPTAEAPAPVLSGAQATGPNVADQSGFLPAKYNEDHAEGTQLVCDATYYDADKRMFIKRPVVGKTSTGHFAPAQFERSGTTLHLDQPQSPNEHSGWLGVKKDGELSLDPPEESCEAEDVKAELLVYKTRELGKTSLISLVEANNAPKPGTFIGATEVPGLLDQEFLQRPQ